MGDEWFMGFPTLRKKVNSSYYKAKNDTTTLGNGQSNIVTATLEDDVNLTSFRVSIVRTADTGFTAGTITTKVYKGNQLLNTNIVATNDFVNYLVNANFYAVEFITSPVEAVRGETFRVEVSLVCTAGQTSTLETTMVLAGQYIER
jgi:hypothetical protein